MERVQGLLPKQARAGTSSPAANVPLCQVEGCQSDLTGGKNYHRRHKVCEWHSNACIVKVANVDQRFCQQCGRFHELTRFDEGKRSCRRRLAQHSIRTRTHKRQRKHFHYCQLQDMLTSLELRWQHLSDDA